MNLELILKISIIVSNRKINQKILVSNSKKLIIANMILVKNCTMRNSYWMKSIKSVLK